MVDQRAMKRIQTLLRAQLRDGVISPSEEDEAQRLLADFRKQLAQFSERDVVVILLKPVAQQEGINV